MLVKISRRKNSICMYCETLCVHIIKLRQVLAALILDGQFGWTFLMDNLVDHFGRWTSRKMTNTQQRDRQKDRQTDKKPMSRGPKCADFIIRLHHGWRKFLNLLISNGKNHITIYPRWLKLKIS